MEYTMRDNPPLEEIGPPPRSREAVNRWLTRWGRQRILDHLEPFRFKDVTDLIRVNGGTAEDMDLSRRDLHDIDLSVPPPDEPTNLVGIILRGAELQGANLARVRLNRADLRGAELADCNLSDAELRGALLVGAVLIGAHLEDSDLSGADFSRANLCGAHLKGAIISPETNLQEVEWDPGFQNVLERDRHFDEAADLYTELKEWYRRNQIHAMADQFQYREGEARTKAIQPDFVRLKDLGGKLRRLIGKSGGAGVKG